MPDPMTNAQHDEPTHGLSTALCSLSSFSAMPLSAALEFADSGASTGGIMTHEALKTLAMEYRKVHDALEYWIGQSETQRKCKLAAHDRLDQAYEALFSSPNTKIGQSDEQK